MLADYADIRRRIPEPPLWFDSDGVPRYDPFHPEMCPNIYADEVALFEIECQSCGERFLVEGHGDKMDYILRNRKPLSERVADWCYGDPPRHGGVNCPAGDTMTSIPVRCVEFWRKSRTVFDWVRVPDLEIALEAAE
jgi:hypothetical protein